MNEEERPDFIRIAAELRRESEAARVEADRAESDRSDALRRKASNLERAARLIAEDAVKRDRTFGYPRDDPGWEQTEA